MAGTNPRVLLIEFLSTCACIHFPGGDYPFIQGFLRARGVPVRWLAVPTANTTTSDSLLVEVDEGELDQLVSEALAFEPTVVVINQRANAQVTERLRHGLPASRVLLVGVDIPDHTITPSELAAAAGISLAGESLGDRDVHLATPDFESRTVSPELIERPPPVDAAPGPPCHYSVAVARNPRFRDVGLDGVRNPIGCTFCVDHADREAPWSREVALERATTILRRFFETAPPERRSAVMQLVSSLVFPRIIPEIVDLGLPPTTFFFMRRADEILRAEDVLRSNMARLAEQGHVLRFNCLGIESFAAAELERFNKGVTPEALEASLLLLHELETEWPDNFSFFRQPSPYGEASGETGGVTLILFTPWTTIDDLVANSEAFGRLTARIELLRSLHYQLSHRLVLLPDTAIARLAERDGLLVDRFPEPVRRMEVLPSNEKRKAELPWRFRNDDVALVYRFLLRLTDSPLSEDCAPLPNEDWLSRGLKPIELLAHSRTLTYVQLFRALVEVVRVADRPLSDDAVLARLVTALESMGDERDRSIASRATA